MLVHHRVTPSIKFAGTTHLYTWLERGTVRVKCLAQEHNTMSPARARTRSAHSGVERTNHEATAPPQARCSEMLIINVLDSVPFVRKFPNKRHLLAVLYCICVCCLCLQLVETSLNSLTGLSIFILQSGENFTVHSSL